MHLLLSSLLLGQSVEVFKVEDIFSTCLKSLQREGEAGRELGIEKGRGFSKSVYNLEERSIG